MKPEYFEDEFEEESESVLEELIDLRKDIADIKSEFSELKKEIPNKIDNDVIQLKDLVSKKLDFIDSFIDGSKKELEKTIKEVPSENKLKSFITSLVSDGIKSIPQPKKETIIEKYDDYELQLQLRALTERLDSIKIVEPKEVDVEKLKEDFRNEFARNFEDRINTYDMPNFRKLAMGLQGQIDALSSAGNPGSPNTSVQFNDGGVFGGDTAFTWNKTTNKLTINTIDIFSPSTNSLVIGGSAGTNILGDEITSVGFGSFGLLSTGLRNSGLGFNAGNTVTDGSGNTFIGHDADASFGSIEGAIALGSGSLVSAAHSMVIGGSVDYINLVTIGNGETANSPQDLIIRSTGGAGTNIQGGDLFIRTGASTGNAVSGYLKLQVSDMGASGTTAQTALDVFTAVCTSASGAFLSMGDPNEQNNKTKFIISDANETIDMELDATFTIADTAATTNRVAMINATNHRAQFGDLDNNGNSGELDINDAVHTHYASQFNINATPSPTSSLAFRVDTGNDPVIQMGDNGLLGNGVRFIVDSGIQQVYAENALMWSGRGTDAASATNVDLAFNGNLFHITGTTTIQRLNIPYPGTAAVYGVEITLVLDSNITIETGTAGTTGYARINLAGSLDWAATAGSRIKLFYDNGAWYEISRTSP